MRPFESVFKQLIKYKIATVEHQVYVYSSEFTKSVEYLKKNPPNRRRQRAMAKRARSMVSKSLVKYAKYLAKKKRIEDMIIAYVCLKTHLKRLDINIHNDELPDVIYGTFYLNDNEPEVWPFDD